MRKSYQSQGQLTPQKVVQLLENGKVANLPLKNGSGQMNAKTKTQWTNASSTTSSANCTFTFFDDARALQTIADSMNLKMCVMTLNSDGTITQGPTYSFGRTSRIFPFKRSDTEIMLVSKKASGWGFELIFVSIDESDNLGFLNVDLFTPDASVQFAEKSLKVIQVEGTTDDYVLLGQYSTVPYNIFLVPFRVKGHTVTVGNILVYDQQYSGNHAVAIAMWDVGKIAVFHSYNNSSSSPQMSTFTINDLTISLLYRDTYPNNDLGTSAIEMIHMAKLSKGRIVMQYSDPTQSGSPVVLRVVEFSESGKPIFAYKKTLVTNNKSVTNSFVLAVNGDNVGFSYGIMRGATDDPFYLRGTIYPWAAVGDEFVVAPYFIYDTVQYFKTDYPGFSYNKSRDRLVISHITNDSYHVQMIPFEIVEKQHVGKVLGVAETTSTVVLSGVANGFQGLVPGTEYTYDENGDIIPCGSKYIENPPIGKAISQNSLLLYDFLLK
jgi:hypothetical protein